MAFTEEEVNEFKTEAEDLLDQCESSLLALEKGARFKEHYDAIFRAFHSIKGAAGMMELTDLQHHMHQLENTLTEQKSQDVLGKEYVDLFLRGSDGCRQILHGKKVSFDYSVKKATPAVTEAPRAPPVAKGTYGKILVVDDEADIIELLHTMLTQAGFEVVGETLPENVMGVIKTFKPNIVMSDISMPKINGLELLAQISADQPDLPVIFISGNVTKESLIEAIKMGVFGVIEKPFNVGRVIEVAHQAIQTNALNKMVNEGINLLMYQFSDLTQYLSSQGKDDVQRLISTQITSLIDQRRKIRDSRRVKSAKLG